VAVVLLLLLLRVGLLAAAAAAAASLAWRLRFSLIKSALVLTMVYICT
jgi:hypothetical protein